MSQTQPKISADNSLVSNASREEIVANNENIKNKEELAHKVNSNPSVDAIIEKDAVEEVVHLMPIVLPLAGAVLMFLLASIAIYMA